MKKTENLELNLIEGCDIPNYAPFNENAEILDGKIATQENTLKSVSDTVENLEKTTVEDVAKLSDLISANSENIEKNTESIANNTANIEKNTESIANNTANIEKNENAINEIIKDNTDWIALDYSNVPDVVNVAEAPAFKIKNGIVTLKGDITTTSTADFTLTIPTEYAPQYPIQVTKSSVRPAIDTGTTQTAGYLIVRQTSISTDGNIKISTTTFTGNDSGTTNNAMDLSNITWIL